jgi:hypothetical protein
MLFMASGNERIEEIPGESKRKIMPAANLQLQINERFKQHMPLGDKTTNHMKAKLGSGARFKHVMESAAKGYEKKGMSPEHAKEVGAAIAAKIGRAKYGAKKFSKLAAMGRK